MGEKFSAPVQTGPGTHPAFCTTGTRSFPGLKSGRGVTLTPHHLLVLWSRKSRAVPLLPLWAVRYVQSLSACTRVHFTFYFLAHIGYVVPTFPNISSPYSRDKRVSYFMSVLICQLFHRCQRVISRAKVNSISRIHRQTQLLVSAEKRVIVL